MTVAQALARAVQVLKSAQVPDATIDARILLADALEIERGRLTLVLPDDMPAVVQHKYDRAIEKRKKFQPISQILGKRSFYGRDFLVTGDVLDPRPDTELLVEISLKQGFNSVLDLGTGSGCILITLLAEHHKASGTGGDISKAALKIAKQNADKLLDGQQVTFVQTDWFEKLANTYDLIVSNPPYISADEMRTLDPDVLNWEPEIALTPGGDGLEAYRILARNAPNYLKQSGRLIVEIGYQQAQHVRILFEKAGFENVTVFKDVNGKDRVISGILR